MEDMYDVFISYCRRNIVRVTQLKNKIEKETHALCWIDWKIESGSPNFTKEIIQAINNCPIFLFMLSKESQVSEYALKELNFAYNRYNSGKKVVIVYIEQCKMSEELEFHYSRADTIEWYDDLQRQKLIRNICEWVGDESLEKDALPDIISNLSNLIMRYPKYKNEISCCLNSIAAKESYSFTEIDTPIFECRIKKFQ